MSAVNTFPTPIPLRHPLSFKRPSKLKTYTLDPKMLNKEDWFFIAEGTSGAVIRTKFIVKTEEGQTKEKKFALKIFHSLDKQCLTEFNYHTKIIELIKHHSNTLESLNIVPGSGIEKGPIHALTQGRKNYMIKKNYDTDLLEAILKGYFKDTKLLLLGSKQLLEGMITLMTIGALYSDIKPDNFLVGRNGKFETVFTDFEGLSFLKFNENDDKIIKNLNIRTLPKYSHEQELINLLNLRNTEKPATEFIEKLHGFYVFTLGIIFFEMATGYGFKDFLLLLMRNSSFHEVYPIENILRKKSVQKIVRDQLLQSNAPECYANLVISMLNPNGEKRISIYKALKVLRAIEQNYAKPNVVTEECSEAQETKQPTVIIKTRKIDCEEFKPDEPERNLNKCRKKFNNLSC